MVLEPLESVTTPATNETVDPAFVSPPPQIRRDDELPSVTGELSSEITAPQVPQFPSSKPAPQAVTPPANPRRRFRRQSRDTGTVSTRTSGGTVVTFPPQNAPGSGPGEIGRVTSSVPATADGALPWISGGPDSGDVDHPSDAAAASIAPGMLLDPNELAQSPEADSHPERAGFLVAPSTQDRVRDVGAAAESGPWLLIDPEDIGRSDTAPAISDPADADPADPEPETIADDPAAVAESEADDVVEEDQDRLVDLEYLFAASTIDVGPIDLTSTGTSLDIPFESPIPDPPQIPEIESASTVQAPDWSAVRQPAVAESAVVEPAADELEIVESDAADEFEAQDNLDALLAEFSAAMTPVARTSETDTDPEPALELAPDQEPETLPELEADFDQLPITSFDLDDVTVPSAEVIDHAAVIERGETVDLNLADITVPSAEVVDHAAAFGVEDLDSELDLAPEPDVDPGLDPDGTAELAVEHEAESEPIPELQTAAGESVPQDPAPAGGMFFDTLNRREPQAPRAPHRVAKSPAEVFASETSLLPARTRRGDQLLVEPHDVGHSWFNKSGELPLLNLAEDDTEQATGSRARTFIKRTLLTVLILGAIVGCLYVALNSIYL